MKIDIFLEKVTNHRIQRFIFYLIIVLSAVYVVEFFIRDFFYHRLINIIILAFLMFLIFCRVYVQKRVSLSHDEKVIVLFTFLSLISAPINHNFHKMNFIVPLSFFFIYMGISSYVRVNRVDTEELNNILNTFIVLSTIHLLFAVADAAGFFKGFPLLDKWTNTRTLSVFNLSGLYGNPNKFANAMVIGLVSSFSLFTYYAVNNNNNIKKNMYLSLSVLTLAGVVISSARASFLVSIIYIVLLSIYVLKNKRVRIRAINVAVLLTLLVITVVVLNKTGHINNFIDKFNNGSSGRIDHWVQFIKTQFSSIDTVKFYFGKSFMGLPVTGFKGTQWGYNLHNTILSIWSKYGMAGLLMLAYLFFCLIKNNFKNRETYYIYFIPYIVIARDIFEDDIVISNFWLFSVFFLIMILLPLNFHHSVKQSEDLYEKHDNIEDGKDP